MTGQDMHPGVLTSEDVAKVRAELERQHGMTPAQAEAAVARVVEHLARIAEDRLP
jgi:predicted 2-oxoglutarate/Fe(II)-dependent dioxygenase YbiX